MGRRHVLAAALVLIMLAAAVVPASAAVEQNIDNYWIEISGGGDNSCTDEWVEYSGFVHYVFSTVVRETGAGYTKGHMNAHVAGTGMTTGAQYLILENGNEQFAWDFDSMPSTYTNIFRARAVTPGPGNNDVFWQRLHITVNADGTVTAEIDESGWECK